MYLFTLILAVLSLEANGGRFLVAVLGLLRAGAFLVPEHRLWALGLQQL